MAEKHFVPKADREYTKADFTSDQMVKWCPGCGDHAILAALLNTFPKTNHKKENICMVSGIGCSSRIPYYVDTYGFHSIHGRACAIATGVKLANPALSVWVSMGGGTIDYPFNPGELVMGAQGTFYARALDCLPQLTTDIMTRAAKHDGTSVVEVLQNCMIFNDKAHAAITDRAVRDDRTIILENGKPMIFGKEKNKGLRFNGRCLEAVTIGENGITIDDIMVHHEDTEDTGIHMMLARMSGDLPVAIGVIRNVKKTSYTQLYEDQMEEQMANGKYKCVDDLLNSGDTWEI